MTLRAAGRLENLKRSVDAFVDSKFSSAFVPPRGGINYGGVPFNDAGLAEWIEPHVLGPVRPAAGFARDLSADARGQVMVVTVQVNMYVRQSMQSVAHRIHQIRDTVVGELTEGTVLPVRDYAGDGATIGVLVVRSVQMDSLVPSPETAEELGQWVYAVNCQWTEEHRPAR